MFISVIKERKASEQITVLEIENAHATASISLFGAQVLSFQPKHDGRERLFLSTKARWDGSKSLRGGIPICWPWFGAHAEAEKYPAHGYVRTRQWQLLATEDMESATLLRFGIENTMGAGFNGTASLTLEVLIGRQLSISLITTNTGVEPFKLGCALHSYFAVSDVSATKLEGLQGTYSDKTRNWAMLPTPVLYEFTSETDRIHLHATPIVCILDQGHTTLVHSKGHDSVVVWNPWEENSRQLPDMAENEFKLMLCVETALTQGLVLAPEQVHALVQTIE
ncbi:MAG: D-hexose-6-phosphate mutarotase [Pseudomonadota bacterium]